MRTGAFTVRTGGGFVGFTKINNARHVGTERGFFFHSFLCARLLENVAFSSAYISGSAFNVYISFFPFLFFFIFPSLRSLSMCIRTLFFSAESLASPWQQVFLRRRPPPPPKKCEGGGDPNSPLGARVCVDQSEYAMGSKWTRIDYFGGAVYDDVCTRRGGRGRRRRRCVRLWPSNDEYWPPKFISSSLQPARENIYIRIIIYYIRIFRTLTVIRIL